VRTHFRPAFWNHISRTPRSLIAQCALVDQLKHEREERSSHDGERTTANRSRVRRAQARWLPLKTERTQLALEQLGEVERAILKHIAQHRFTLTCVLRQLFRMSANELSERLAPLTSGSSALLLREEIPDSEQHAYSLSDRGVEAMSLLCEHRCLLHAGTGTNHILERALSTLWYCSMGERRLSYLDGSATRERFGDLLPASPHTVSRVADKEVVERLYIPSSHMLASDVARHVSLDLTRRALAEPEVRAWISRGRYHIALLADEEQRLVELRSATERRLLDASVPVHYELAPAPRSLDRFVAAHEARKSSPEREHRGAL